MVAVDAFSHALTNRYLAARLQGGDVHAGRLGLDRRDLLLARARGSQSAERRGEPAHLHGPTDARLVRVTQDRNNAMLSDRPAFDIGFVLAGAISAGCYSAGVTGV